MIESTIEIKSDLHSVYNAFYDLHGWKSILNDVTDVDVQYEDGNHQVFTMTVDRPGGEETVRGIRTGKHLEVITLCQTTPPPGFRKMHGHWYFEGEPGHVTVRAVRDIELIDPASNEAVKEKVQEYLERNLGRFKEYLENEN